MRSDKDTHGEAVVHFTCSECGKETKDELLINSIETTLYYRTYHGNNAIKTDLNCEHCQRITTVLLK